MLQNSFSRENLRLYIARSTLFLKASRQLSLGVFCLGGVFLGGCSDDYAQKAVSSPGPRIVRRRVPRPVVPEKWRYVTKAEQKAAQRVVLEQLRAFRDRDYKKALALETPQFAARFPTLEALRKHTEDTYPNFGGVKSIQWQRGELYGNDETLYLKMRFTTTRGEIVRVFYMLRFLNNKFLIDSISTSIIGTEKGPDNPWPFRPAF